MHLTRIRTAFLSAAVLLAAAIPSLGKGVDDFTLAKAIPADAFLAIHTRGHDGQKFLNEQYARVWAEFEKLRLERDLKRLIKKTMQDEGHDVTTFDDQWQMVSDMITSVGWSGLGEREYAFCMKLGEDVPVEFISLMMPAKDKVQANFDGLSGILQHLAKLAGEAMTLATEGEGTKVTHKLSAVGAPFPLVLTVARHDDVIAIGFGATMVEQSLAMLGGASGATMATTPNFQSAFKKLPPPTDSLSFVDFSKFFTQLRAMMAKMKQFGEAQGGGPDEEADKAFGLINKMLDGVNMFEFVAACATTDGMKTTSESIAVLRADAKSCAFYPIFMGNPAVKDPLKYVPKDASDFAVNAGINLREAYKLLIKVLKEDVPEGEQAIAEIESMKEQGIDLENDVFGWLQGSFITISQPGPTPYAPGNFAFILPVTDEEKGQEVIGKLLAMAEPMTQGEQAMVRFSDAEVAGKPFKSISVPMLAAMAPVSSITFGITDKMLMVVSSTEFAEKVLETGAGKAENISKSERFLKEGLAPSGDVLSISFTDQTNFGEQWGTVMGMASLGAMQVRDNPVAEGALTMISKLGRVVKKMDFFLSSASISVQEGNVVHTKSVSNYRPSPTPKKPTSTTSENKPE